MGKNPRINVEAFHAEMFRVAHKYAISAAPKTTDVKAMVLEPKGMDIAWGTVPYDTYNSLVENINKLENDKYEGVNYGGVKYNCLGTFSLPPESASLIFAMARCTLMSPLPTACIEGHKDIEELPFEVFSLGDLLNSGYPRNTRSGIMKGTIGASFIDGYEPDDESLDDEVVNEVSMHRRFAGICIMIMSETRNLINQVFSDDQVLKTAWKKELVLCLFQN
jgi:hypothetical protein